MTTALTCMTAWCAAVAFAEVLLPGQSLAGAVALGCVGIAVLLALLVRPAVIGLALAAALAGVVRVELTGAPDAQLVDRAAALAGSTAVISGRVEDDPRPFSGGYEVLLQPDSLTTPAGPQTAAGGVMVRAKAAAVVPAPGDRIQAVGQLRLPQNRPDYDSRAYLAQRGAYLEMPSAQVSVVRQESGVRALPGWLRDHYRRAIEEVLPQPHAALLVGVVLGVRTGIPPRLNQDLIATGLVHLLVLSGLKVAVFARLVKAALAPVLGRAATVPAVALIALYALTGGATPAGLRAAAMGGLALTASQLGRPTHVWSSLSATAAAMLAWRPDLTWDVGFQLSFVGTAAIVLLTPSVEHRLRWMPGWLREPFAVTCAAQVGTVPFMVANFNVLSPIAPVANAVVLPLLPAMVAAGLLLAPLAMLPAIGQAVAIPLAALLAYVEQVAGVLARVPGAAFPLPGFPAGLGLAYYVGAGAVLVATHTRRPARRAAIAAGLVIPVVLAGVELVSWGRPDQSVAVMAVGAGQAVLLAGPDGFVLVDGGSSPTRLASGLGTRLPPWRHDLSGLIVTGSALGHAGGLAQLDYAAKEVLIPEGGFSGSTARKAVLASAVRGATVRAVHAGDRLDLAGLHIEVLAPESSPPEPAQMGFRAQGPSGRSFCDLADMDPEAQAIAAARLAGGCTYLLLPGGGSSAPAPELMAAARPRRLVASDAGGQLAGDLAQSNVLRTSQEGDVVLPL
jgi:competence protein ComEC